MTLNSIENRFFQYLIKKYCVSVHALAPCDPLKKCCIPIKKCLMYLLVLLLGTLLYISHNSDVYFCKMNYLLSHNFFRILKRSSLHISAFYGFMDYAFFAFLWITHFLEWLIFFLTYLYFLYSSFLFKPR